MTIPTQMRFAMPLTLVALTTASFGQSVLYTFNGDTEDDEFGWSVSGAGDVNGDGFDDLIVGAPGGDEQGEVIGSVRVLSGLDGSILYTFYGGPIVYPIDFYDGTGRSVSGAGDVNGDGFDDIIIGAATDVHNCWTPGSARVISGIDGSDLYWFYGYNDRDDFGRSVSGAGDVNGDGFDDMIVGAYHDDTNGADSGSARVLSGVDGSVLYTVHGDSAGDNFGFSVSGAGDVNGDGFADLIVGARNDDNNGKDSGSARVFSGLSGTVLYTFDGDSPEDAFGNVVSGAGDVNGDGFDDMIVGVPLADINGTYSGSARVFSGLDGSILYTFNGDSKDDYFGNSVSGAGDVNGDGYYDLIVGAWRDDNNGDRSGSARVFSGKDGSVLCTFDGDSQFDWLGMSVSGAGDVNGDGIDDMIVGAPRDDNNNEKNSGSARVFSGFVPLGTIYCDSSQNPNNAAGISISTLDSSASSIFLTLGDGPPGQFAYLLVGDGNQTIHHPPGAKGDLCVVGGNCLGRYDKDVGQIDSAGTFSTDIKNALSNPCAGGVNIVPGASWNFQFWHRQPMGQPATFSAALAVTFE